MLGNYCTQESSHLTTALFLNKLINGIGAKDKNRISVMLSSYKVERLLLYKYVPK